MIAAGVRRLELLYERTRLWLDRSRVRRIGVQLENLRGRACHCPPLARHYLHSEGLREGCDYVLDYGSNVRHPSRPAHPLTELGAVIGQIPPGSVVYVKAERLAEFLPHLRTEIVLVTGDSDYSPVTDHRQLLEDRRIIRWFAQNCDLEREHGRLIPIPIGLDNPRYHRMDKRLGFLLAMLLGRSPIDLTLTRNEIGDQEALQRVPTLAPRDKPARALCTFHLNQKLVAPDFHRQPERLKAWQALRYLPWCYFPPRRLPQRACWELHRHFAFEVSPPGNGLDCFRTWEALALGTIPIVSNSPLNRLHREFPIVIVESWKEITRVNLERWKLELQDAFTPELTRRLSCDFWLERIRRP